MFNHQLTQTEITHYVVSLANIPQITANDYGNNITVIDNQNRNYNVQINNQAARIDGLSVWYQRYNPNVGQTIHIEIINATTIRLCL